MKTKISHLGRSTVSVILAVMMLLSTMLIGTISVNAADFFTVGDTLYLDISGAKYDATADNAEFYIKFYKEGSSDFSWSKLSQIENSKVYSGTVPNGDWNQAVFTSVKGNTFNPENIWDKDNINSSAGTTIAKKGDKNCWSLNNKGMEGTWTTYSGGSGGGSTEATFNGGDTYYLQPTTNYWNKDSATFKITLSQGVNGSVETTIDMTKVSDSPSTYCATLPEGSWNVLTFKRMNQNGTTKWNSASTSDSGVGNPNNGQNCFTETNWNNAGTWSTYSATAHVADSASLTASPETVKVGNPVTLTAVANNPASSNLTYTFTKTSGGEANETQNNDTLTVTPTVAGTYKYTVTVSADGYSPVTSTEVSFTVTDSVKYYICGRFNNKWHDPSPNDPQFVEDESNPGLFYYETGETIAQLSGTISETYNNTTSDYPRYFYVNRAATKDSNYLTTSDSAGHNFQNNTDDRKLALSNQSGTDEKFLVRFDDVNNTSTTPVTIWLDTRNNEYKLWYTTALPHKVNVAEGVSASVDKKTATAGETVTVTATPGTGEVLQSVTVVGENGSTPIETTVSGNSATFKMPDQNVTVTGVTFRTANTYTVTFSSSNETFGTVSAMKGTTSLTSGDTVTEGDEVTFTATQNQGYTFTGWTVNGAPASSTTNPYKITVNSNTTVVANFKVEDSGTIVNDMYFLYGSKNDPRTWEGQQEYNNTEYGKYDVYEKDGKYIVTLNEKHYKELYFAFSKDDSYVNMEPNTGLKAVNSVNPEGLSLVDAKTQEYYVGSVQYLFGKMSIVGENSEYIGDIKIIYDPTANTYTVKATKDSASDTTVNITGKDGTIRAGYTDTGASKTTAVLGDTTLSITTPDDKIITASDSYKIDGKNRAVTAKKVPYGSTVTVTTTINPDATFAGHNGSDYYVKGFSVNGIFGGVLSQTEGKNHSSDVYTYTFEVNQEIYDSSKLEITPVYFLKNDDNCVYFYIENYDSAKQIWGNTPSCYVYYGSGKTTLEALGYYPGQPMVDYNGSIFTQIPKFIVNGDTTEKITGMTLNNYVWDDVHRDYNGKVQKSDNAQTYDYDDFVKIAESGAAADNIIYRFKYNTHDNVPGATLATSDADAAGWEVFLDYQNYPTDIFGNKIGTEKLDYKDTQSVTSKDNYLSIISDGYQNNYIGKYATAWSIYNKAGDRVATIPSSALLYALGKTDAQMETAIGSESTPTDFLPGKDNRDKHWATFKTLYNDYKGVYAQINFEAAIKGGDDYGNRLDGRWYYSQSKQKITGEIKIQYANTLDDYKVGGFHEDTFENASSIVGTTTGASAYFTDPENKVRKLVTEADNTQDYKFKVTATSTAAYTFVGWYRLIDGDYKAINPSDMSSLTGAVTRNSDVTLVARYIKTPGGSMTFHHSLYNGTNAGGGKATTEIQVVVKNSEDVIVYDSGKIAGTASIDKTKIAELAAQTGLTVTVTLYTTTKNLYNFNGYYSAENTTDITAFAPTTGFTTNVSGDRTEGLVTTSEYTFSFNDYYTKHKDTLIGDNAGTVYYNFYSDITSIKVPYKVQFSYIDRMGDKKYYNKAGYVDPENTSSYTFVENATNVEGVESHSVKVTLTDSFILSLAPYESNFTKNLTWNETPISNTAFDSSVTNSIASAVVNSTQSDRTIHLNVFRDNNGKPTPLINDAGQFKLYEKDGSPELPYGSVFYTKKDDGTYTYDITAQKTYTDESGKELQFMYWAIYSDPECKNLVINAYNSEGAFSYVAYDNCWIVPVYGESSTPVASVKEVSTSTQFMEVTRNQWTADKNSSFDGFDADSMNTLDTNKDFIKGNDEDKLYADFVLNFFYNGKQLNVFDPNSSKVQTGIVMQKLELEKDSIGVGYNTDMKYYANKYTADLSAAAEDAKSKILTGNSSIASLTKQINNNRLDNKNRLQYYARFNNTEANANCVYRVYTYIKYLDESNKPVVQLGNPIYFTLYDIANATV